ncbi:hypothetical protein NX905_29310, partial [Burkholderia thailandensis]|uniref:hypothetical protein n=1 Tax=Burkholderia thailandensis TaxID=57975 RepID=UPI00217EB666
FSTLIGDEPAGVETPDARPLEISAEMLADVSELELEQAIATLTKVLRAKRASNVGRKVVIPLDEPGTQDSRTSRPAKKAS